jgi:hypothetical protein
LPPGGSSSGGGRGGFGGGMFGGPASASQGYVRPTYGVDIAVRYEFLKNRAASVSANMNDIFRTRRQDTHSESAYLYKIHFAAAIPRYYASTLAGALENLIPIFLNVRTQRLNRIPEKE